MAEMPKIVLPHGGYKKLIVYRKSDVIYQGTVAFCRRFLPARGEEWDKAIYSRLAGAATAEELAARSYEMQKAIARAVCSIKRRKGW